MNLLEDTVAKHTAHHMGLIEIIITVTTTTTTQLNIQNMILMKNLHTHTALSFLIYSADSIELFWAPSHRQPRTQYEIINTMLSAMVFL